MQSVGGSIDTLAQTKGKQIYVKTAMYKVRKSLSNKTENRISVQDHELSINNWIQLDFIQQDTI